MDATAQELVARLRRNPDDADAFAALRAHYQRIGDYASLANLLEGWAGRAPDPNAAAHALYEAGELVLGALADRERAVRVYERALSLAPRHQDAFLRLRGLFEDAGEMRRLADLLERQGQALQQAGADPRDVALLYHQLGELWEHRFSRVDKAVHHYRKAFELDPTLVTAIYAAREIYRAAGNMKAAASLLEKEAKAELDGPRKVALWRELAHLRAESLDDQEGAALALKRALSEAPGDLEVMSDLARVYLSRAERSEDPHVAASDRHRAADLLYQMAQQVPTDHALAYLEQALDARPDHDGALSLFERMCDEVGQPQRLPGRWVAYLGQAGDRPEAAYRRKRLADAYLEAGQVDYAVTCLEWLLQEGDPEAAETLVELYRQQGREQDAVRALGVAAQGLPPAKRIPRLRELLSALRDQGEVEQAGEIAAQILEEEPDDPEAMNLLEEACRKSGRYEPYRDALLRASRVSGLSAAQRKERLQQVARLSEKHLDDPEGAISAWRGVAALDPADENARRMLERLFTETERWDDLVELLEREALSMTEPEPKAELYRRLASVHEGHRGDLEAAIQALRHLRDLLPGDEAGRDALADALVRAGAYLEAIPLLRQRIDGSSGEDRAELLRLLATILEDHVEDEEGAFETWAMLLDERPNDLDAIAHMEAIDQAAGRHERLLSTLSYKVEVIAPEERPAILVRMASVADGALHDLDRAAELYARALELAPGDEAVLDALCDVYDRAERFKDLVVLLREQANRETEAGRRAELYRRIARTLAGSVGNDDGAAEAWREVLVAGEDLEALTFLRRHATRMDDVETLEDVLARLTALTEDEAERRELLLERAGILADRLDRPRDAIGDLRRVVDELAPDHVGALQRLAQLSEQVGDLDGLADALWRQLDVVEDPGLRVPVARRLSDLHEKEAPQVARAVDALYAWAEADLTDPEPLRRLAPLLQSASRWQDLASVLDSLAALETDPAEVTRLTRRAADVAYRQLGDVDGAWARLEPRVRGGDADAEADLRELAQGAGRGEALAELYVSIAHAAAPEGAHPDPATQQRRWMDAAGVYETNLGDAERALEAVLRAFAVDLDDRTYLDEADRLAEQAGAWERLGQVYETLVRRAADAEEKVALLLRHAGRLDERAQDVSAALDQTLRACSLAPEDDDVLALAEERAPRAGRADELLISYDKRRSAAEDDAGRVDALLRSARWCERTLGDRERVTTYLAQAVALTVRSPELAEPVEGAARELDEEPGASGGLRRAVVELYAALAEDMEEDPVGGARLLLRASRLLHEELDSDEDAFAVLKRAASFAPGEDEVLDELDRFAHHLGRLDALDAHLDHLVEEALDNRTASSLLRRRGSLLEEELTRYEAAADVWARLSNVTSGDPEARERLRSCLRKAGKHQDLLVALQRDLRKADDPEARIELLRETARVWDQDLGNRWEALDAWKKLLKEASDDAEATEAIARLQQKGARPDDDLGLVSSTDREIDTPESVSLESTAAPDAFDDVTESTDDAEDAVASMLSEDAAEPVDSSETVLDSGLYRELSDALETPAASPGRHEAPTANVRAPRRQTRELDASEAPSRDEPMRAPLDGRDAEARALGTPEVPEAPRPGRPENEFEEDFTAVAEDVFDQLRDAAPADDAEEIHTGEIELLEADVPAQDHAGEEALDAQAAEVIGDADVEEIEHLSGLEEIDPDEAESIEELTTSGAEELDVEEIEEIDDFEPIEDPPKSSAPPPPPPRRD